MSLVATIFVIIHNMIVDVRKSEYQADSTTGWRRCFIMDEFSNKITFIYSFHAEICLQNRTVTIREDRKIKDMYRDLKAALITQQ